MGEILGKEGRNKMPKMLSGSASFGYNSITPVAEYASVTF
jgi:hypothetical protein